MQPKKQCTRKLIFELLPFFLLSAFLLLCVFLIGHFESYTISAPSDSDISTENTVSAPLSVTVTNAEKIPYITDIRVVSEYKNGIGVFDSFGNLLEVHPLDITRLPLTDRQLLKDGMIFDSEGEVCDFIESLDS